jgi:hypothetical protein
LRCNGATLASVWRPVDMVLRIDAVEALNSYVAKNQGTLR